MNYKVNVVVGRFQVPELTMGHIHLINSALEDCNELIIFVGCPKEGKISNRNPLPFEARKSMIENRYEIEKGSTSAVELIIRPIEDLGNFPLWVEQLDTMIEAHLTLTKAEKSLFVPFNKNFEVTIFGSRDSMIDGYIQNKGKFTTKEIKEFKLDTAVEISGSNVRNKITNKTASDINWDKSSREMMIWAVNQLNS